ncbi:MAG: alpha/beta hydrolase [Pseudomonadales bacterium]|nr:alpha/beta hydrolase [Pseudomonadales bacterium]
MPHSIRNTLASVLALVFFCSALAANAQDISERVKHNYADNDGVKIHYVTLGNGPLMVMVHGFPDYWYSWRHQMEALSSEYTVAALDTRGYNLSDQPSGVENYELKVLVSDVAAVIEAEGEESAIIVGHDWGGGIAWSFAALEPEMTEQLIIMNLPHPRNLVRELARFEQQHQNSVYARNFQQENSHEALSAEGLATALSRGDSQLHGKYLEAFGRSSFDAMMNYYRANYPRDPYTSGAFLELPEVQAPVLQFHGLLDTALLAEGVNNTWEHLAQDWTLMTIPGVSHWPHHDRPEMVSQMMSAWLEIQRN